MLSAVTALLVLPGVVAFAVPLLIVKFTRGHSPFTRAALVELTIGTAMLLWPARDFYVDGGGTLAPWSPPRSLVRGGLYRWTRNPMYIGVLLIVAGWALGFRSQLLWIYAAVLAAAFHLRVVLSEEPYLARTYGDAWPQYRKRVPRWLL
jgi:protein-S-isoprenylcysteine O-methyltransferase Ste14